MEERYVPGPRLIKDKRLLACLLFFHSSHPICIIIQTLSPFLFSNFPLFFIPFTQDPDLSFLLILLLLIFQMILYFKLFASWYIYIFIYFNFVSPIFQFIRKKKRKMMMKNGFRVGIFGPSSSPREKEEFLSPVE